MSLAAIHTPFLSEDFLLQNEYARALYHNYAKNLPIIDYHNHLSPNEINQNKKFENLSKIWLAGDHYKWRAMRTLASMSILLLEMLQMQREISKMGTDCSFYHEESTLSLVSLRTKALFWN